MNHMKLFLQFLILKTQLNALSKVEMERYVLLARLQLGNERLKFTFTVIVMAEV